MKINAITINRAPNNYIGAMLASLRASDWQTHQYPVTLCAGNYDTEYLTEFGFDILPWREAAPVPNTDNELMTASRIGFCMNYTRALRHGFGDVVVLEDDIELCPNWLAQLHNATAELAETGVERYVLSLYSANNLSDPAFNRGEHYRSYWAPAFYGTQAVYFPENVRYEIADYVYKHRCRRPGDMLISEWADLNNCLYALQGSVVQHMGRITTGVAGFDHQAWNLLCQ